MEEKESKIRQYTCLADLLHDIVNLDEFALRNAAVGSICVLY